jgi:hypothetical protein
MKWLKATFNSWGSVVSRIEWTLFITSSTIISVTGGSLRDFAIKEFREMKMQPLLEQTFARTRDGGKSFTEALMCRTASFVVAD